MTIKIIDQDPAPFITKWKEPVKVDADVGPGFGLYFEADSVARSLRGMWSGTEWRRDPPDRDRWRAPERDHASFGDGTRPWRE